MKRVMVLLIILFILFFVNKNVPAQLATVTPGEPRYVVCDQCGYCPPHPVPQSWSACQKCLYPEVPSDPTLKTSLLVDPVSGIAPTVVPGKLYTFLGCLGNGISSTTEEAQSSVVQTILNILFSTIGGIAFLFLLYGAFIVTTSQANPKRLNYGKRIIYGAIAGLLFSLLSVLIVKTIYSGVYKIPQMSSPNLIPHPSSPPVTIVFTKPTTTPPIDTPTSLPVTPTLPISGQPTPTTTIQPTPTLVASACSAMDNDLPNSIMRYPEGYTGTPTTTKQIFNFAGTKNYSIPYRNPNCSLSQAVINNVYEKMKSFYPNYWQQSKLLDDWETVQSYAIKYNFNPIFVIALWVEESAAGGATNAQKLGCVYRLNKDDTFTHLLPSSTICEQMECLFGRWSVYPQNYALFGCQYQFGSDHWVNNQCTENPEFVKTVEFWYNFMSGGQPTECQVKYCPNAPGC